MHKPYLPFIKLLKQTALHDWAEQLPDLIDEVMVESRFGNLPQWQQHYNDLPELVANKIELDSPTVTIDGEITPEQQLQLRQTLMAFHPWRKGPFSLFDINIDTEWRSDWKWDRLLPHINPLPGKRVLDVGCGSGYHCWRMRGAGADLVMGIDPSPLFVFQYQVMQKYIQDYNVAVLPIGIDDMPAETPCFDTVFSMGVLYHRRSPIDHLIALRDLLVEGGELVLETLVVEGDDQTVLMPGDRYARMGNVWFLPSVAMLENWLAKVRFKNIRTVDVNQTSTDEQRATEWMTFHSLENFLDPEDSSKTIEGYPAPRRAVVIATR